MRVINLEWLPKRTFGFRVQSPGPNTPETIDVRRVVEEVAVARPLRLFLNDGCLVCNRDPVLFAWRRLTSERSDYYTVRAGLVGGDETDPGPIERKPGPRQNVIAMF